MSIGKLNDVHHSVSMISNHGSHFTFSHCFQKHWINMVVFQYYIKVFHLKWRNGTNGLERYIVNLEFLKFLLIVHLYYWSIGFLRHFMGRE